jgi:hypothetical protein
VIPGRSSSGPHCSTPRFPLAHTGLTAAPRPWLASPGAREPAPSRSSPPRTPRGGHGRGHCLSGASAMADLAPARLSLTHGQPRRRECSDLRTPSALPRPAAHQPPASVLHSRHAPSRESITATRHLRTPSLAAPRRCARCPPRRATAPPAAAARYLPPAAVTCAAPTAAQQRAPMAAPHLRVGGAPACRTPCGRHAAGARACEGEAAAGWRRRLEIVPARHEQGRRWGGRRQARVRMRHRAGAVVALQRARRRPRSSDRAPRSLAFVAMSSGHREAHHSGRMAPNRYSERR